jgi:ribulose 1,5-bisphosphate synthetase/thiazole synthase
VVVRRGNDYVNVSDLRKMNDEQFKNNVHLKFKMNFNLKFSYEKFDFIIIGSGQAGIPLAFSLSKKGTVALIEKKFVGTCVNNGCTPAYVASA